MELKSSFILTLPVRISTKAERRLRRPMVIATIRRPVPVRENQHQSRKAIETQGCLSLLVFPAEL